MGPWKWVLDNHQWLFDGVGVFVFGAIATRILRSKRNEGGAVTSNSGNLNNSNIAGGDIYQINLDRTGPNLEELARICEHRAIEIEHKVQSRYRFADVESSLKVFRELHKKHVAALRAGRIIEAHEILKAIHQLSCDLEWDEIRQRHDAMRKANPYGDYAQSADAGQRGPLICGYIGGEVLLNSPTYPDVIDTFRKYHAPDATLERVSEMYKKAFYRENLRIL